MLLAIDIGNTNIVVGVFEDERLKASWRIATDIHRTADEYAAMLLNLLPREGIEVSAIRDGVMCSVVPQLEGAFYNLSQRYFKVAPLVVQAGVKTGVRVATDNPREVGADRIVNAAAAHRLYGGTLIIIDFGTAATFDVVSAAGDYLGGAIAPGINIAAEALFMRTAKLPQVEVARPKHIIGKNTVASIQAGVFYGYIGMVEGIVARMKQELGGATKVIATGGYGEVIASATPVIEVVNPDLTLIGLRLIYEMNQEGDERA